MIFQAWTTQKPMNRLSSSSHGHGYRHTLASRSLVVVVLVVVLSFILNSTHITHSGVLAQSNQNSVPATSLYGNSSEQQPEQEIEPKLPPNATLTNRPYMFIGSNPESELDQIDIVFNNPTTNLLQTTLKNDSTILGDATPPVLAAIFCGLSTFTLMLLSLHIFGYIYKYIYI